MPMMSIYYPKKPTAKNAFQEFKRLEHPLHCFLASCFVVFNKPKTLQYTTSKKIEEYLIVLNKYLNNRNLHTSNYKKKLRKRLFSIDLQLYINHFFTKNIEFGFLEE